jgi:hypothetical protein
MECSVAGTTTLDRECGDTCKTSLISKENVHNVR